MHSCNLFQMDAAREACRHLKDDIFLGDCKQFLNDKDRFYDICVADMCRNGEKISYTPMCTITSGLAKLCADKKRFVNWDFEDRKLKRQCSK